MSAFVATTFQAFGNGIKSIAACTAGPGSPSRDWLVVISCMTRQTSCACRPDNFPAFASALCAANARMCESIATIGATSTSVATELLEGIHNFMVACRRSAAPSARYPFPHRTLSYTAICLRTGHKAWDRWLHYARKAISYFRRESP